MLFLIDENLTASIAEPFTAKGFLTAYVGDISELRGKPDEVIFDYAVQNDAVIVTRDRGFASILRFDLSKLQGMVLLRFHNEIAMINLIREVAQLITPLSKNDFNNLIVIEPGALRKREL